LTLLISTLERVPGTHRKGGHWIGRGGKEKKSLSLLVIEPRSSY